MAHNYFSIKLPSKCLLYKDVNPDNVKVRVFTGADEAILSEISEKNATEKITEVLGRCLQGIDIKELTLGDKLFLMTWHAINSYSDGFSASIVCEHCLLKVDIDYKLGDAEIVYLPDTFKEPIDVPLSDNSIVHCRLARVKDELSIDKLEKQMSNTYLYTMAMTIIDKDKDIVQRVEWLENMPSKDTAKLRAVQDSYYHGLNFALKYTCPKCAGEGRFTAPFRFEHFFPYGSALVKNFGTKV